MAAAVAIAPVVLVLAAAFAVAVRGTHPRHDDTSVRASHASAVVSHGRAPGPHPDPLPGTERYAASSASRWAANVPARYTVRLTSWSTGDPDPLGPLDLSVETHANGDAVPVEVVVAAVDPNRGIAVDPGDLQRYSIGMLWQDLQALDGCGCTSGTMAGDLPVAGVFSEVTVRGGAAGLRIEISGFWLG